MYYAYERIWASVRWGRSAAPHPMSTKEKVLWFVGTAAALALIFFLLLKVHPKIKARQTANNSVPSITENRSNASFDNN